MDKDYVYFAREQLHKAEGELEAAQHYLVNAGMKEDHYMAKYLRAIVKKVERMSDDLLCLEEHAEEIVE